MFGKHKDVIPYVGQRLCTPQAPSVAVVRDRAPVFVEFEGALCEADDSGRLEYSPRGKISINVHSIGGFYDHRILVFGNKVHVMETRNEIELKIREALK